MIKEENILKNLKNISNKNLEEMYYASVFDSLGSELEEMYNLGYDIEDIKEQDKFEKYKCRYSDILEKECLRRKINIWG